MSIPLHSADRAEFPKAQMAVRHLPVRAGDNRSGQTFCTPSVS